MEGSLQPVDPDRLFADWLARSGAEEELEALCREHGEHAAALRELHADWLRLHSILQRAGLGISAQQSHSFALRLKEQYGSGVDPAIALERGEEAAPASSQLLARLAEHSLKGSRYQLKGELARGGMGAILKVWDEDLRRSLAMKVILGRDEAPSGQTPPVDKRLLARFLEEAQVTGQLDHPGIVPVHELGLDAEGRVYFTMKLVKGRDLKTIFELVCAEREDWNETRALGVILKVCEAMAYAHAKGVVHRDLKPANVMVGNFGEVYVMDWGLARVLGREDRHDLRLRAEGTNLRSVKTERREERSDAPDSPILTMDGDIVGTPAYMPPEQARGEIEKIGPHSDVYAIGAVLYHLLARQMPFVPIGARITNRMILGMVVQGPPARLTTLRKDVAAELVAICEKAMTREPGQRYRDTLALAEDLRAYLERRVVKAYRTGPLVELKKWVERNKGLAGASAAAVLALVAGVVMSLAYARQSEAFARSEGEARREAQREARRADDKAREADRSAAEANRLRDEALARANALWAIQALADFHTLDDNLDFARAQDRPTHRWWLEKARELVDGMPYPWKGVRTKPGLAEHEKLLEGMLAEAKREQESNEEATGVAIKKASATLKHQAVEGRRSRGEPDAWSMDDAEMRWWIDSLVGLCQGLRELRDRVALVEQSLSTHEAMAKWNEAIEAIAASSRYGGLRITPQIELVPLGPDPDSGLWEFDHLGTGEPAVRGSDGKLTLKPETGIVFVLLPSGRVPVEDGAKPTPLNEEQLDPFFLSKYEMTIEQWKRTSRWTGSILWDQPLLPANGVSWDDSVATLERAGLFLRLPSEAQWEYGCRAGTTTPWWTGAEEDSLRFAANVRWKDEGNPNLQAVGSLDANPFGLHGVHGNVGEWCSDEYGNESVVVRPGDGDRLPTGSGSRIRVARGGGFFGVAADARSGERDALPPEFRSVVWGLRVARRVTP